MFLPRRDTAVAVEELDQDQILGQGPATEEQAQLSAKELEDAYGPVSPADGTLPRTLGIESLYYTKLKRAFDLAVCLCLLPFAGILLLFITVFVFVSTGGPVFYRQQRVGQNGQPFTLYKFRTMRLDAAEHLLNWFVHNPEALEEWKANHKLKNDPRIIRGGRFLRKTSLDELPQLVNVLRGEMTLVGPRPIVPAELAKYGTRANIYLAAVPGLTGLWQVSGRCNVSYEQRVEMDEQYVRQWSFARDIKILLRTPLSVFRGDGAC